MRHDCVHAVGERFGVAGGGPLDRRRRNGIVNDQHDIGRFSTQTAFRHHLPCADDGDRYHRQAGLDREQKAAALEARGVAIRAACPLGTDQQ